MMLSSVSRIPVTVLTGYLGAGKTTLLNRILSENHGQRIAVIENEFGEVGIDHELVIQAEEEIFETNNGCLCCTVRGDLLRILERLLKRRHRFDHILIETTGLADPGPVVQTFLVDDPLKEKLLLNAVVTLVDACHLPLHLEHSPEAKKQIAMADALLLNKADLVSAEALAELESRLRSLNPLASCYRTTRANAPLDHLLSLGGFDLQRALAQDPHLLEPEDAPHHHLHEENVTSVGIEIERECDGEKLEKWLSRLLQEHGTSIYRMKGVFAVRGNPNRVIFQGVHMTLDVDDGGPWGERRRGCRLVFIGKNLSRLHFTTSFRQCLV